MTTTASMQTASAPANDGLNTSAIAIVGFLSAILVFACIVGLQALYAGYEAREFQSKVVQPASGESAENLLAEQESKLVRYGWIDRAEGRVAIPIDRAMEMVTREQQLSAPSEDGHDT